MLALVALVAAILLQFVAVFFALRLTKKTKYRLSWILISAGFLFMAVRRFLEFISYTRPETAERLSEFNNWLSVVTSFVITAGVILISELFNYLQRVEKLREDAEKRVLNAIIQTEENERKRFAKDLHDGLGPLLSSVKMSVSSLKQLQENSQCLLIIGNAEKAIGESIRSIKDISNNLSPHILNNFGLAAAIRNFTGKLQDSGPVGVDFETNMQDVRFEENKEVILYRVVCELINNTLKHAGAKQVRISLQKSGSQLRLTYSDNGKGFEVEKVLAQKGKGMGLPNMLSRIKSVKGDFDMFEMVQGGIRAEVKVKIRAYEND